MVQLLQGEDSHVHQWENKCDPGTTGRETNLTQRGGRLWVYKDWMLPFWKQTTHSQLHTRLTSYLTSTEEWKTESEDAYGADTTQQQIHFKARPDRAEHAAVCHGGIVLFLCNTQMIKEFNTVSRLMTPLGCRGTRETKSRDSPENTLRNRERV